MDDQFTVAASVAGVVILALHSMRLLLNDLSKIIDAPSVVTYLKEDVSSLELSLKSLQAIEDRDWVVLGDTVATQSKAAVSTCEAACEMFRGDLHRWTRRAPGGKLSWTDRDKIGFLKEHYIQTLSEHLQSSKLTCNSVVEIATRYNSFRNGCGTGQLQEAATAKEADLNAIVTVTNARLAAVEASLATMTSDGTADPDQSGSEQNEDGDAFSAIAQLQEESNALKASRAILLELLSQAKKELVVAFAEGSRHGTMNISFSGNHNFQVGINNHSISRITIG